MVQSYCSGTRFKHRYIYLVIHEFRLILGPLESQGVVSFINAFSYVWVFKLLQAKGCPGV